jgi:hypothetical protein
MGGVEEEGRGEQVERRGGGEERCSDEEEGAGREWPDQ